MNVFSRLFQRPNAEPSVTVDTSDRDVQPPEWNPKTAAAQRLMAYGRKVANEITASDDDPQSGARYWVVSWDVSEAVWFPAAQRSWAATNGRHRDGWSQGNCLVLFADGSLASADWFGEVYPNQGSFRLDAFTALQEWQQESRWSSGNLAKWRPGGGGLHPHAQEHFKAFRPPPRKALPPWAGTSAHLKRFLTGNEGQLPPYY